MQLKIKTPPIASFFFFFPFLGIGINETPPPPENCKYNAKLVGKIAENCAKFVGRFWLIHTNLLVTLSKNQNHNETDVCVAVFSNKADY